MASDEKRWLNGQGNVTYHDRDMAIRYENNPLFGAEYRAHIPMCQ
jgi:hypothetical protein